MDNAGSVVDVLVSTAGPDFLAAKSGTVGPHLLEDQDGELELVPPPIDSDLGLSDLTTQLTEAAKGGNEEVLTGG